MSRAKTHRPKTRGGTNSEGTSKKPRADESIPFDKIEQAIDALDALDAPPAPAPASVPRTRPPGPPPKSESAGDSAAKTPPRAPPKPLRPPDPEPARPETPALPPDPPAATFRTTPPTRPPVPGPVEPAAVPEPPAQRIPTAALPAPLRPPAPIAALPAPPPRAPAPIPTPIVARPSAPLPPPKASIPFPPANAAPAQRPPPKLRAPSIDAAEDLVVDVEDLPELRPLDVAIYEAGAHLASARTLVTATGNTVMIASSGPTGIEQVRSVLRGGGVDVLLVVIPGGEALIETSTELVLRPIVIAACAGAPTEAVRRAAACGADLVTLRPHDVERLAPVLLAAGRLLDERHAAATARASEAKLREQVGLPPIPRPTRAVSVDVPIDEAPYEDEPADDEPAFAEHEHEHEEDDGLDGLDGLDDALDDDGPRGATMQPFELFQQALDVELDRARRESHSIALALFVVELDTKTPPPGIPGILRARAGTALIQGLRGTDIATELDHERFLVLMPETDLAGAAEVARAVIEAVAEAPAVTAAGRRFQPRLVGAVASASPGQPLAFAKMMREVSQALEQARRDGAELAVPISGSSRGDSMDAELDDVLEDVAGDERGDDDDEDDT